MVVCSGAGDAAGSHCCYQSGQVCKFLEVDTVPGRKFACGLRRELSTWAKVNVDPRYQAIGEHWESGGQPFNYCETFQPSANQCCQEAR
jgi:hypothetical protein